MPRKFQELIFGYDIPPAPLNNTKQSGGKLSRKKRKTQQRRQRKQRASLKRAKGKSINLKKRKKPSSTIERYFRRNNKQFMNNYERSY